MTEQGQFANADLNYQTAMAVPNPTDMNVAAAKLNSDDLSAIDAYNKAFIKANGTWLDAMNKAYGDYLSKITTYFSPHDAAYDAADNQCALDMAGITYPNIDPADPAFLPAYALYLQKVADAFHNREVAYANADLVFSKGLDDALLTYSKAADDAQQAHESTVAGALLTEQKAFDANEVVYQTSAAEARRWTTEQRADADRDRQQGYDLAEEGYAVAQAKAAQVFNDALALAADNRGNTIADALETEQLDDAQALAQAGQDLAASVAAAADPDAVLWANYQSALAGDQSQHQESDATAQNQMAHTEDDAAYADATAVDQANETRDETIALDRQTEQDAEASGWATYLDGYALNQKTREVKDAGAWQTSADSQAGADQAFNAAAISAVQKRCDADALAAKIYADACATAVCAFVGNGDGVALDKAISAADLKARQSYAADNSTFWYAQTDANLTRAKVEAGQLETYTDSLAGDLDAWSKQNDTLEGGDEITVGTALATQDKLDTAARDTADATAADQAAIEIGKDAVAEQGYNDSDAGYQQTQDVNDALASQILENTEAGNYSASLTAWAASFSPLPPGEGQGEGASAAKQASQAVADYAWTESVTAAEVADVQGLDGAQVAWAIAVDAAAEVQQSFDANAVAGAIDKADTADAQRASDADLAWTTEVQNVCGAITTYDQAAADAAAAQAESDAKAGHTIHDAWDKANWTYTKAWVDASTNLALDFDAAAYNTAMVAARAAQVGSFASSAVDWANTSAANEQTYMQKMADAKLGWVSGVTGAEADYVKGAATASATETKTDALAVAAAEGTEANDESGLKIAIAQANTKLTADEGTADTARVHSESEADAADEVSYAQADADYQEGLETDWANSLSQAAANSPSALANYNAAVAQADAQEIGVDETHVVAEVSEVTQANVDLADDIESDSVTAANTTVAAIELQTITFAPQEAFAAAESANNVAQTTGADADAQATFQQSVAGAAANFYQDKAIASRTYDYAVAAAGVASVGTLAPEFANWFTQLNTGAPITEDLTADSVAAAAAYDASEKSARTAETTSYGDAEIAEAKSIGLAEKTLANAAGADEVGLQEKQMAVANTLAAQGALADETLVATSSTATGGQASSIAGDVAEWTESAGDDEKSLVQQLGDDHVDEAQKIAGAEADYAIAEAQTQAAIAASLAQGATTGQAAFDALYAEGYVQWLTDLKPSFVANATAVAQDDAGHRESLAVAVAALANGRAAAAVDFVSASGATSAEQANSQAAADDGYQTARAANAGSDAVGVATADSTQDTGLGQADAAYMLACAKADKDAAVNYITGVSNWQTIYKDKIADGQLVLARSQADADLAWIQDAALADTGFLKTDATDWQTMIVKEAQAADKFSHEDDATTQTEQDALAVAEAGAMKAQASAEQAQTTGDAAAAASFRIARANETATVWTWLAGQLGNTPWAQSQAGLAGAEAGWAVTAAALYQQYIGGLGTNAVKYANTNADQFVGEMEAIDLADRTDSDKAADAGQTLADSLSADESALEQALAGADLTYQDGMGQADHDYRYAVAQAIHDLTVNGDAGAYAAAMAQAEADRSNAQNLAVGDFEALVDPAVAQKASDDADAELTQVKGQADAELDDALQGDLAVNGYAQAESAAFAGKQKADAQALRDYQVFDANGHAAAIAACAQANPSPWAGLAAALAAAQAAQQVSDANAALAQANGEADAQQAQEQADADAEKIQVDALAQARHDQTVGDAQAVHDQQVSQGDVTDAVFALLPDLLVPPDDGPAPTLTPDFTWGYEANDFWITQTTPLFGQASVEFAQGSEGFTGAPHFMPGDLSFYFTPYESQGDEQGMVMGRVGNGPAPWTGNSQGASGVNSVVGGGGAIYGNVIPMLLRDLVRAVPLPQVYQSAMHFTGVAAAGLLFAATGEQGFWETFWFGKNHPRPSETPSTGGGVTVNNNLTGDPLQDVYSKINQRGAMTVRSGAVLDNKNIKNSIHFGNFLKAIYEGMADALEDQIWNLATAGVLGDAEAELVGVAAKKVGLFSKQVIDLTIGQITKRISADDVAKIQKVLKDRGAEGTIEEAVAAIKSFAQQELKQAKLEIIEKPRWGMMLAKLWKQPDDLVKLAEKLGGQIHAHHIVMKTIPKNRSKEVQDAIRGSQEILKAADINLFDDAKAFATFANQNKGNAVGAENFAWALARKDYGLHGDKYALKVYELLQKARDVGGKQGVKAELERMRGILEKGGKFW